jgi:lysophospholipase L1-like esterase
VERRHGPFVVRIVLAILAIGVAFGFGFLTGTRVLQARLQHFTDAYAQNESREDQYPNHNVKAYRGARLITVIGDSISTSHYRPHRADGEYPFLVATSMHANLLNLAVPGWETDAMIAHALPLVPRNSDVVIYEGGTNDLIYTGLAALPRIDAVIAAIRARAPHAKILVIGVRGLRNVPDASIRRWNERERTAAHNAGARYIDLYSAFPPSDLAKWPDGVHPNGSGARKIATMVERVLAQDP